MSDLLEKIAWELNCSPVVISDINQLADGLHLGIAAFLNVLIRDT